MPNENESAPSTQEIRKIILVHEAQQTESTTTPTKLKAGSDTEAKS